MPDRDQRQLETKVLVLQSTVASFLVLGVVLGWFGTQSHAAFAGAAWIGGYHIVHAVYVLRWRIPGRPNALVETLTPPLDVSCITTAWVVLGDPLSPFWGAYLYALVGYGRRYVGKRYALLAGFIVVNIALARVFISVDTATPATIDANLLTMIVLALTVASLAHAIGSAWRSAEHRARVLAEIDALTGIANRRVFLERLEAMGPQPVSGFALLMIDLDDFKSLNDEHGHLYGDRVLQNVAHILQENVRHDDHVARYGGEEFVVMMPDASLQDALAVAERLRCDVMTRTPATVSVGCAAWQPGESAETTLRRADDLLLAAKRNGKNSVRASELRLTA